MELQQMKAHAKDERARKMVNEILYKTCYSCVYIYNILCHVIVACMILRELQLHYNYRHTVLLCWKCFYGF